MSCLPPDVREKADVPLETCLNVAGVMIVFIRPDFTVGLINRKGREVLGYAEDDIVGRSWIDSFLPRRLRRAMRSLCEDILSGACDEEEFEYGENTIVTAGGEERLILWHSALVRDDSGEILGILSSGQDITEQRKADNALKESEARFRAILETTVDAVITADEQGRIESFNPSAERIFGYSAEEVLGRNLTILMPPPDSENHEAYMARYLKTGKRKIIGIGREAVGMRKGGSVFPIDLSVSEVVIGGRRFFTGIIRDISDRRELEQEVLRISEEERQRIGRDLHDGLGSLLSGLAMGAQGLARSVHRGAVVGADDLERLAEMIEQGAVSAQSLSRGLNPVKLEKEGLVAALEELAATSKKLTGVTCNLHVRGELPHFEGPVATQLYRIAQEAVNNAIKHAHPTRISIELAEENEGVRLTVRDDGIGLPEKLTRNGLGMHIMPYRARMINGLFSIGRVDGRGTYVTCSVPSKQIGRSLSAKTNSV